MIECKIQNGYVWLINPSNKEAQDIYNCLTFDVPNREHMPLFKQGKWDGKKKFMDWRSKTFRVGLLEYVQRKTKLEFEIIDDDRDFFEMTYFPFKVKNKYELRDFQVTTIKKLLKNQGGLAALATNAGKTACIAGIVIAAFYEDKSVLILEGMVDLLDQVKDEIESCASEINIEKITAKEKSCGGITISMIPTLCRIIKRVEGDQGNDKDIDYEIYNWLQEVDVIILDECHHGISNSVKKILDVNKQAYRFGFSGTIPTEDTLRGIELKELFGDILCTVTNKELIKRKISAKPLINMIEYETEFGDKIDNYKASIKNTCFKRQFQGYDNRGKKIIKNVFSVPFYTSKIKTFVMNYSIKHNKEFIKILMKLTDKYKKQSVIILVDWKDFGLELSEYLECPFLYSQVKNRKKIIKDFSNGAKKRLIATSVLDEGMSIDRIKVLILANAGSSKRQFLQRIGRGLRRKLTDNKLIVYDFVRFGHKYLIEPSKRRVKIWKDEGFKIEFVEV